MSGNRTKRLMPILALAFWIIASSPIALAVVKDTDVDGLTDGAETNTYLTDPNNYDTDGDGAPDGNEVIHNTNPLDPQSNPFIIKENTDAKTWQIVWIYAGSILIACGVIVTYLFLSRKKPASQLASRPEQTS